MITILALGGTMLGATTIAGLLMLYQVRQATDLKLSNKAVFAANTAVEWGNYQGIVSPTPVDTHFFNDGPNGQPLTQWAAVCYEIDSDTNAASQVNCDGSDGNVWVVHGFGRSGVANRWFRQAPTTTYVTN